MARPRRPGSGEHQPADLFSIDPTSYLRMTSAVRPWPDPTRFSVNHAGGHLRQQVGGDLIGSQRWLELVAPSLEAERAVKRPAPYLVLKDIDSRLIAAPLPVADVERSISDLPVAAPLERRVSACILGVPDRVS